MALRVALVGGPMYDGLYSLLPEGTEVVVHADHPTLNRAVADLLAEGTRIDLLSTHSKYAPSQGPWLQPLDAELADGMANRAVDLCTFEGDLLCVPRNIDVRVMWVRRDLLDRAPATWAELLASDAVFGFTGRESGLFGTFFEYVAAHGGDVFDVALKPTLATPLCEEAVDALLSSSRAVPRPTSRRGTTTRSMPPSRAVTSRWQRHGPAGTARCGRRTCTTASTRTHISRVPWACARTPGATDGRSRGRAVTSPVRRR